METSQVVALLASLSLPIALIYIAILRRGRRKADAPSDTTSDKVTSIEEGRLIGTAADLEEAERRAADLPADMRVKYADTKEVLERFSTRQGYTETYMEDLAEGLRRRGIECEVYFQPGAIPGIAGSFIIQHGLYELWVDRAKLDEARTVLNEPR